MSRLVALCVAFVIGLSPSMGLSARAKVKVKVGKVKSGKVSSKKSKAKKSEEPIQSPVNDSPLVVQEPDTEALPVTALRTSKTRHQINSMFGIHVVKGSALLIGLQYGYRGDRDTPLYFGFEYNFSLYSPGSILGILAGGWSEFPIEKSGGPTLCVGLVAGAGFTTAVIATPPTVFLGFLDLAYSQPVDDLFDLRIQLRPGYMHRYIAFIMNLSVAFRLA